MRINAKILTAQAKIPHTRKTRETEDVNYARYKIFSSRHNANLPKLDPLVSKRMYHNIKDEAQMPLLGSYSKASLGRNASSKVILPIPTGSLRKSGSVPAIDHHPGM